MIQGGEDFFPPLAVSTAWHYLGRPQMTVEVGHYGVEGVRMGDRFIPTDESGQLLINYLGPPKTFPMFPSPTFSRARSPKVHSKTESCWLGPPPWESRT